MRPGVQYHPFLVPPMRDRACAGGGEPTWPTGHCTVTATCAAHGWILENPRMIRIFEVLIALLIVFLLAVLVGVVLPEPIVECLFGGEDDRLDRPQRVVEVERDREDAHRRRIRALSCRDCRS